ncbi:MAG TPA: hypothetical protein VGM05_10605 [Planctomycetaceae bacterium]|jgi:hypothetical protein
MHRNLLLFVVFAASSAGCAVYQLGSDQDKIRCTLLDLYTNQIVDNLIRAHNKLPIIQMDYSNATATVTMKETSGVNNNLATTSANVFTAAAGMLVVTNTTLNTVTGMGSLDHTNQISVVGTPLASTAAVYDAYEKFLSDGGLNVTCDPPSPGAAHVCKRSGNLYYWVPVEYQKEFLRLSLATTAQRAPPVAAADVFYSVNIVQLLKSEVDGEAPQGDQVPADAPQAPEGGQAPVEPPVPADSQAPKVHQDAADTPPAGARKLKYWLTIKIDKKIPIDEGYAEITSGGQGAGADKTTNPPKTGGQPATSASQDPKQTAAQTGTLYIFPLEGAQTGRSRTSDELRAYFDETNPPGSFKDFYGFRNSLLKQPLAAKVYLQRHRPQTLPPGNDNSRVEFFLQQIQQGQFRNGTGP